MAHLNHIDDRAQYAAFGLLSLGAISAIGLISVSHPDIFQPYLGSVPPLLAVMLAAIVGYASLRFLHAHGWEIFSAGNAMRGIAHAVMLAVPFAIAITIIDVSIGFPKNLNVPLPMSLLFYPAMAYLVEIAFHVILLVLLVIALGKVLGKPGRDRLVWLCILLVAIPEPVIQVFVPAQYRPLSWLDGYVVLHVFVFNLVEMYLFRRYDFVSMISFRLVYYLYWHIAWGYLRLNWILDV
ncbi:MAG TPA: hypothetical protein VIU46_02720 [Gallionellaceae bacterium]